MNDPNPAVVDAEPAPAPAPAPLLLAERYPACFDWEHPRPLKIDIHQDLMAAGHDRIAVRRALGRYCQADRYRRALQTDAPRIDLQGQPAGAVTEREAAYARSLVEARATPRAALVCPTWACTCYLEVTAKSDEKRSETQGGSREAKLKEGRSQDTTAGTRTGSEAGYGR